MTQPRIDGLACAEALDLVEPHLDGDLSPEARAQLEAHLDRCPSCSAEAAWAQQVHHGLGALPVLSCPPSALESVLRQAQAERKSRGPAVPPWLGSLLFPVWRPLAAALVLALVATAGGLWLADPPAQPPPYTQAQLAQAKLEAQRALALVAELGQRASLTLRDDVIRRRITEAPRTALERRGREPAAEPLPP